MPRPKTSANVLDLATARVAREAAKRCDALARDFGRFMMVATGGGLYNARLFECHDEILGDERDVMRDLGDDEGMCAECYELRKELGWIDDDQETEDDASSLQMGER
jgi:hypothetical protein